MALPTAPRGTPVQAHQVPLHTYTQPTGGGPTSVGPNPGVHAPLTPGPNPKTSGIQGPAGGTLTNAEQSAWSILQSTLQSYGFTGTALSQLVAWARREVIAGNNADQITLDLQQQPQFIARFPAIEARLKAGLPPISAAEYLSLESSYEQLERAAGIPPNFASYDKLIAADVSPAEYSARIQQGYEAVANADPTVVKAMQDFYGVTHGQLAAYFLDPTKAAPILAQQAISAQIGGASAQAQFSNPRQPVPSAEGITQAQALRLAQMGVTQSQAQTGFQQLSLEHQLCTPLPGQGTIGNPLSTDQLLNAQFGSDGQTKLQLELQGAFEKGTTAEGTQVGSTSSGATGVGQVIR